MTEYRVKNDYAGQEAGVQSIPDDASMLEAMLSDLKKQYRTGITRSLEFRIAQLQSLSNGLMEMKDEICEGIRLDLGRGHFNTYCSEVNHVLSEIAHSIAKTKEWMADISVDT